MSAPLIRSIIEGSPSLSRTSLMRDHIKEQPSWQRSIERSRWARHRGESAIVPDHTAGSSRARSR